MSDDDRQIQYVIKKGDLDRQLDMAKSAYKQGLIDYGRYISLTEQYNTAVQRLNREYGTKPQKAAR